MVNEYAKYSDEELIVQLRDGDHAITDSGFAGGQRPFTERDCEVFTCQSSDLFPL